MTKSEERKRTGMPNVDAFGDQLVQAAHRNANGRRRLKRFALPAAVVGLGIPASLAIASATGSSDEPRVVEPGETITVGFTDPATDEPLRCPDGSLFTWTVHPTGHDVPPPKCDDGSVPDLFAKYQAREQRFLDGLSAGDPMTDIPHLPTFEVPGEG